MDMKWQPAMTSAISEVLETMFFESVDFEPRDSGDDVWYCQSAIRFSNGKHSLEITLRVTEIFIRMIAANFLGLDEEEVSQEELSDVMRELVNMTGGNYLRRLKEEGWRLGIPVFKRVEASKNTAPSGLAMSYMGEQVGLVSLQSVS